MPLKRSRNVWVAIPKVRVRRDIARRAAAKRLAKNNIRNVRYWTTNDARPRPWRRIRKIGIAATPRLLGPHLAGVATRRDVDARSNTDDTRMLELAGSGADRDRLHEQFTAIRDELTDLWRLAKAAAQLDPRQP
jgi:hypothetical protein